MKRSASETIKNGYFNLERLSLLFTWLGRKFQLWNGFGTALFQRSNFSCAEPNAETIITYFESETENVLGTAVEWLLSSASETTGVLLYIWVGPNSN